MRSALSIAILVTAVPQLALAEEATRGNESAAIASLERAYTLEPSPEVLLGIATLYERWPGHCAQEIKTFKRFFETCAGCASLAYATERFDLAVEQCTRSADEEITLRQQVGLARTPKVEAVPADATRREVLDVLHLARDVDPAAAAWLTVTLIEAGVGAKVTQLDELRASAWAIVERADPTAEQVALLIYRLRGVDDDARERMMKELLAAGDNPDVKLLRSLRSRALRVLDGNRTRDEEKEKESTSSCRADRVPEIGYLTVSSKPWSEVYVNGELQGTTPLAKIKVRTGCNTIRAVSPEDGREVVTSVRVRPNLVSILAIDLAKGTPSSITEQSAP